MNTYTIPPALEEKYKGAGHALAAVTAGQLVALQAVIQSGRLASTVREPQALGDVAVGVCGGWTFTEV